MKKITILLLIIKVFCCCQKENEIFDMVLSRESLSFEAIAGGAIMRYNLPSNEDILAIRVRYQDAYGQEILRAGSYACDSLVLTGFNEAKKEHPAFVSLLSRDHVESEAVEVTFDTENSAPVAFFDSVRVESSWNGFLVMYDAPANASGMAHVLYAGTDPRTGQPDTLLVNSFLIKEGRDTLLFALKQPSSSNTVVIRTEDFRGYMVKQKVWEGILAYNMDKMDPSEYEFIDPLGLSKEDPDRGLGKQFLFDGNTKGEITSTYAPFNTYLAGPNCKGKPLFILDLKDKKMTAEMRLYAMLYTRTFPNDGTIGNTDLIYGPIWKNRYYSKLPCKVSVYGSNDMNDDNSWVRLAKFEQERYLAYKERWTYGEASTDITKRIQNIDDLNNADPIYMDISFPPTGEAYRYLKLVVDDIFGGNVATSGDQNVGEYVTIQELEVFCNKD